MLEITIILSCFFILVGLFIGYWIMDGYPKAQAKALQQKFGSLGNVQGKTLTQIKQVVGTPTSFSSLGNNKSSYSWSVSKYYVTLQFDGEICEGVTSEISV